jgi:hypothetical protein
MWRWGLVATVFACSCQSGVNPSPKASAPGTASNDPFISRDSNSTPSQNISASEEANVIRGAMDEFFSSRWQDWNSGDFIALEPAWTIGQFDSVYFDKALAYWTTKFGNDGDANNEETLKRIQETLVTAGSPPASVSQVEKPLDTMDLGTRIVIVPTTYFDTNASWVPGAVQFKSSSNMTGGIRARGALAYPMFSGNGQYAFLQMNHVGSGRELGQLHFFLVKTEGKWKALAVGRAAE